MSLTASSQCSNKRTVSCSLCHTIGHNKRTCRSRNVTLRTEERNKMRANKTLCENVSENNICAICLDKCGKHKTTLECGHTFDTKCIFSWLSKNDTCPCCRANIPQLKKSSSSIKLPAMGVTGAIYRLCCEAIGEEFMSLPVRSQIDGWYMMFKDTVESLSPEQYNEFSNL